MIMRTEMNTGNVFRSILAFEMLMWVSASCLCTIVHNSVAPLALYMQHSNQFSSTRDIGASSSLCNPSRPWNPSSIAHF